MSQDTGKSPNARPCPRCGRPVGGFFGGGRFQPARHKTPDGKPCRYVGEGGDRIPDLRGCAPCRVIDDGGSGFCRDHSRAHLSAKAHQTTRDLITALAASAGVIVAEGPIQ